MPSLINVHKYYFCFTILNTTSLYVYYIITFIYSKCNVHKYNFCYYILNMTSLYLNYVLALIYAKSY